MQDTSFTDMLANQTLAFFAAHPDDIEVMLGYAVLASIRAKAKVYAFIATDGEASTLGDPTFVKSRQRRREAVNGLKRLGIMEQHIILPSLPDGGLQQPASFSRLSQTVASFIEERGITVAFTTGPDGCDGHADHIAVHDAVVQAGNNVTILGLNKHGKGAYKVLRTDETRGTKLEAVVEHGSQFSTSTEDAMRQLMPYQPYVEEAETYDLYQ